MYSQTTLRARRYAQAVVTTSLEVIGLPSLHLRPELSLTVNVLALWSKPHSLASSGIHRCWAQKYIAIGDRTRSL